MSLRPLHVRICRVVQSNAFGLKRYLTTSSLLMKKAETPVGKLDETAETSDSVNKPFVSHRYERFPGDINPETGEQDGPRGPEPTRYGDWERRGRCIDF